MPRLAGGEVHLTGVNHVPISLDQERGYAPAAILDPDSAKVSPIAQKNAP